MKKKKGKVILPKKFQLPFSDYGCLRWISGFTDPKFNDLPLETYIDGVKIDPAKESGKLKVLVGIYKMYLEDAQKKAMFHFNKTAEDFRDSGYLTKDEWTILCKAEAGNIKATQAIVNANPDAIQIPFIAETMIELLRKYKNTPISKDSTIEDLKLNWLDFLPSRAGRKIPYTDEDMSKLITIARKQGLNRDDAIGKIAEALGISEDKLKKSYHVKERKGRPKNSK